MRVLYRTSAACMALYLLGASTGCSSAQTSSSGDVSIEGTHADASDVNDAAPTERDAASLGDVDIEERAPADAYPGASDATQGTDTSDREAVNPELCQSDDDCPTGPCILSACEAGTCETVMLQTPCEDGDPCTLNDSCVGGVCVSGEFSCSEVCGSEKDEDQDGASDCDDSDCWSSAVCDAPCRGEEKLSCGQQLYDSTVPTDGVLGSLDGHCGLSATGGEQVYTIDLPDGIESLELTLEGDGILAVYPSNESGACATDLCLVAEPGELTYVLPDGPTPEALYVVVDSAAGQEANFVLSAVCTMPAFESCLNGLDDDGDGAMDCEDEDCVDHPICGAPIEDCDNGIDDDLDGLTDCEDSNCASAFDCAPPETCAPMYDLTCGSLVTETIGALGSTTFISDWSCEETSLSGAEMAYRVALPIGAEVQAQLLDGPPGSRIMVIENAETCSPAACIGSGAGVVEFIATSAEPYAIVVDTPGSSEGDFTLGVSCVGGEQCDNVIDDDLDGVADCQDADCFGVPPCDGQVCQGDLILFCDDVTEGTLTAEGTIELSSCGDTGPGGETIALFTSAVPTQVTFTATGPSNPRLFALDASGICDTGQCLAGGEEQLTLTTPGQKSWYILIDGDGPGEFTVTTNCSDAEVDCTDGLDGDGDGATDCDDSDCLGATDCAPSCPLLGTLTCGSFPATTGQDEPSLITDYGCLGLPSLDGPEAAWRLTLPDTVQATTSVRVTLYDPMATGAHLLRLEDGPTCNPGACIAQTADALSFDIAPGESSILAVDRETSNAASAGFVVNCHGYENACVDGIDGDGDGLADCADPDCANLTPECPEAEFLCEGGLDDDGDGLTDCADPDCLGVGQCPAEPGTCLTSTDSFCNEPLLLDTAGPGANQNPIVFACGDQAVSSQQGTASVVYVGEGAPVTFRLETPSAPARLTVVEADGLECDPLACVGTSASEVSVAGVQGQRYIVTLVATSSEPVSAKVTTVCEYAEPDCLDGVDDDNDGATDCLDPGCANFGFCQVCLASDGLGCGTDITFVANQGPGSTSIIDGDCGPSSPGPERTFGWVPSADTGVTLTSTTASMRFHVFAQGQVPCDGNACVASGQSPLSFNGVANVSYYIVADTVDAGLQSVTVSMDCDITPEICDNGVDDDLDSQTDCDDLDCKLIGDCGSTEVCDDGEDNDGDGQTDCEDTACIDLPGCQ